MRGSLIVCRALGTSQGPDRAQSPLFTNLPRRRCDILKAFLPVLLSLVCAPPSAFARAALPASCVQREIHAHRKEMKAFYHVASSDVDVERFQNWLLELKAEAIRDGVSEGTVERELHVNLKPNVRVQELDQNQPEVKWSCKKYLSTVVSQQRIRNGIAEFKENSALIRDIAKHYDVDPFVLVSFWGIESNFGRLTGSHDTVEALATLAFDDFNRGRSDYFRRELLAALKIIDAGHAPKSGMKGSWAGALGQCQFMPSSFGHYATDYDGDGRADIWESKPDVLASIANYLVKESYYTGENGWGYEVKLPTGFDRANVGTYRSFTVAEWGELHGVYIDGKGKELPPGLSKDDRAFVVMPDNDAGPAYLVHRNFTAYLRYNPSTFYAVAVAHLASSIKDGVAS